MQAFDSETYGTWYVSSAVPHNRLNRRRMLLQAGLFIVSLARRLCRSSLLLVVLAGAAVSGCGPAQDESRQQLETQRRTAHPEAATYLVQAEKAYRQGFYRKALALTDSARALAPGLADISFLRGHIFTELKQLQKAQKAYRAVADKIPAYEGVWFNLANNEFRRGNFRQALKLYRKELQYHPSARVHTYIGRSYARLNQPDSAASAFHRAIKHDSSYASAYMRIGQLYEDEGDLEKALQYTKQGFELDPDNTNYRYILGSQLYRTGNPEQAVQHLRRVVQERPSHHSAHYNLGQALLRLGRREQAERYLDAADSLEQLESEVENLRSVARSHPDNLQTWLQLGDRLQKLRRHEEALRAYKIARSIAPGNLVIHGNIANLYQAMGETQQAMERYRAILKQDSTIVPAWFNMGVIYANAGRTEDARRCWQNVLRYAPDHQQAQSYLRRLDGD